MKTFREFLLEYIGGTSGVASYGSQKNAEAMGTSNPMLGKVFNINKFDLALKAFMPKNIHLPNNCTVNADDTGKLDRSKLNITSGTPHNIIEYICDFILEFCLAKGVELGIGNNAPKRLFNINPMLRNKLIQALKDENTDIRFSV